MCGGNSSRKMTDRGIYIRRMFSGIAFRYDFLNALLSFGRDKYWRRFTASRIDAGFGGMVLDIATGTGDLAVEVARRIGEGSDIVGVDFCQDMLVKAQDKIRKSPRSKLELICAQAELLPFPDNTFDSVTIGFGLRNADIGGTLGEIARVLKEGGKLLCLEFSQPRRRIFGRIYSLYLFRILPFLGKAISGNKEAYAYLPRSISEFPSSPELKRVMEKAGLRDIEAYPLTFGAVTVHVATRKVELSHLGKR